MACLHLLVVCTLASGGEPHSMPAPAATKPAVLLEGLGTHHHPVWTANKEAQRYFDQGLVLLYGFNHDEAARSFRKSAELDPKLAMAWWGVALVLGPNYNLPTVDADQAKAAYDAMQKALNLAESTPGPERDYIRALAARHSADPKADGKKLLRDYADAMRKLAAKYPDDLDAATLFAESAMNLRPWKLWSPDGKPAEGTDEIVGVLESVLRRCPDHPGANHYYIHAVEASPNPERALPSAARLEKLVPAAGHLVHMPAHIYARVGDQEGAARANELAILADRAYLKRSGAQGIYPLMYYSHNIHFLAAARAAQGRYADAKKAAGELAAHVGPHVKTMPMLEGFLTVPTVVAVRAGRWDDILAAPPPENHLRVVTVFWRFARGTALAVRGKADEAEIERQKFLAARDAVPADLNFSDWNTARSVLEVAEHVLAARVAVARNDRKAAAASLAKAIAAEDALHYGEPSDWLLPARETLGAVLLVDGDGPGAEKVFRADLERNRLSPRSLFGLAAALRAQGNVHAARLIDQEARRAWRHADAAPPLVEGL